MSKNNNLKTEEIKYVKEIRLILLKIWERTRNTELHNAITALELLLDKQVIY